ASSSGLARAGERGIGDPVREDGDLHVGLTGTMRDTDLVVMSALHFGGVREEADSRIRFAHVGGGGIEALLSAQIGTGGRVVVFDNSVGRKVKVGRTVGPECSHVAQELDGLQFA